jgi:hypothetical protein
MKMSPCCLRLQLSCCPPARLHSQSQLLERGASGCKRRPASAELRSDTRLTERGCRGRVREGSGVGNRLEVAPVAAEDPCFRAQHGTACALLANKAPMKDLFAFRGIYARKLPSYPLKATAEGHCC